MVFRDVLPLQKSGSPRKDRRLTQTVQIRTVIWPKLGMCGPLEFVLGRFLVKPHPNRMDAEAKIHTIP